MNNSLRFKEFRKDYFIWQDSEFIRKLRSHNIVNKQTFSNKKITTVEQEYWYNSEYVINKDNKIYLIYDDKNQSFIGYVNLELDSIMHRRCRFDYIISPEFYYMKYDVRVIKWIVDSAKRIEETHKLWCYVLTDNKYKIKILNENGFEIDAILRDHIYKECKFRDVYIMSSIIS